MKMREDIKLIAEFERFYEREILRPFVNNVEKLISSTGFENYVIPKTFKEKLKIETNKYAKNLEKGFREYFEKVDGKVYEAWYDELSNQLEEALETNKVRFKRTDYLFDDIKKRVLKKEGERWLTLCSLNKHATFNIWKIYDADGLKLSDRIWKMADEASKNIQRQVMLSLQTGMSADRLKEQILKTAEQVEVKIPKYLENQLKNASPNKIAEEVAKYVERKESYNAKRVARTEIQKAWRGSYMEQVKQLSFVKGIKWNLSGSHREKCVCEDYARANLGLGMGVYPVDAVPNGGLPPHPNCFCYLTSVLDENIIPVEGR